MKTIITTIVCTLLLVLTGCNTDQAPTEVLQVSGNDLVKSQPLNPGATVVRYEDTLAVTYYDFGNNLRVIFGVDMSLQCTGIFEPDVISLMEVHNPVDQLLVNQLIHGDDIYCWVYPLYAWDCERFLDEGPIASGFVDLVSTDNDLYAFLEESTSQRINTFGTTANGSLYTPEDRKVLFTFVYRFNWPGAPTFEPGTELACDIHLAFTGR